MQLRIFFLRIRFEGKKHWDFLLIYFKPIRLSLSGLGDCARWEEGYRIRLSCVYEEASHSGLVRSLGKRIYLNRYRRFESSRLRQVLESGSQNPLILRYISKRKSDKM